MPNYRFQFDEEFLIECFRKYRRQHGTRFIILAIKLVAGPPLLALAVFCAWESNWKMAILPFGLVLAMFGGHLIDYWLIKRRFRKSPYWNDNVAVSVTADGINAVGSRSDTKFAWTVITRARRFANGFLLFQGPGMLNWLPDTALSDSTPVEVESLIQAHVKDYKVVEQQAR